tara:strand:+ start:625 stop:852 length:228 start_codon:yes stop_codon:yes gene_type:complete
MTVIVTSSNFSDLTAEEQAFAEQEKNRHLAEDQARADAEVQKDADAKAGNDKLIELGLTQDQVTAMTGYTPPVAE